MRHARPFIAILTGVVVWGIAAATVAYAKGVPDPHPLVSVDPAWVKPLRGSGLAMTPTPAGTPLWQVLTYGALGILLAVAIVGLGYSLSHSRRTEPSTRLHA